MIGATFWSWAALNQYVIAIPYTQNSVSTGPYLWSNQGQGNQFARPVGSPGGRVGAVVSQFLMLGDIFQQQQVTLFTGDGTTATFTGFIQTPMIDGGSILDQQGTISGAISAGVVSGTGVSGSVNYTTGAISLTFTTAPAAGDVVFVQYTQAAPFRCSWSAIGDPTTWPIPLTNAAIAVQSGQNDLAAELGKVQFIAGYPLYALVFQEFGITRASYIGGNVVFSWQPYEFKRGLACHGGAVKVGPIVYYLSPEGFFATDGANVYPVGTAQDNSAGIDNWFWTNVNASALESIRAGYDSTKRSVFFAIPTGSNTLPDTLLIFNTLSQTWTKAAVPSESIWTADNGVDGSPGTRQLVGIFDQTHTPNFLTGSPALTGYLESCDVYITDGVRRLVTGVRPQASCTDLPLSTVGSRDVPSDVVVYDTSSFPDQFSRYSPALSAGFYNRVRVQSGAATSIAGATLLMEKQGTV